MAQTIKGSAYNAGDLSLIPGLGRYPGGGHGNSLQLPGESQGQNSLMSYSPWGSKELNMTEQFTLSTLGNLRIGGLAARQTFSTTHDL